MALNTPHNVTLTEGQIGVILCSLEKSVKYAAQNKNAPKCKHAKHTCTIDQILIC